jgi:hypothetical protein
VLNSYEVPAFSWLEAGKGGPDASPLLRSYTFPRVSQSR